MLTDDRHVISTNRIIRKSIFPFKGPDGGETMNELNEFNSPFRGVMGTLYCVLGFVLCFILGVSSVTDLTKSC